MVLRGIAWSSAIRIRFDRRRPFGTAAGLGRSGPLVPTAPAAPAPSPAPPAWRVARRFRGIGGRRRPLTGSGAGLARGRIKVSGARLVPPRRRLLRSRRLDRRPAAAGRLFSAPPARSAPGPSLVGVVPRRRQRLRLQDLLPVERQIGIRLLDAANRVVIESRPSDLDVGGRAEPVQDPHPYDAVLPKRMAKVGVGVAALVAGKPKERHPIRQPAPPGNGFRAVSGGVAATIARTPNAIQAGSTLGPHVRPVRAGASHADSA